MNNYLVKTMMQSYINLVYLEICRTLTKFRASLCRKIIVWSANKSRIAARNMSISSQAIHKTIIARFSPPQASVSFIVPLLLWSLLRNFAKNTLKSPLKISPENFNLQQMRRQEKNSWSIEQALNRIQGIFIDKQTSCPSTKCNQIPKNSKNTSLHRKGKFKQ